MAHNKYFHDSIVISSEHAFLTNNREKVNDARKSINTAPKSINTARKKY